MSEDIDLTRHGHRCILLLLLLDVPSTAALAQVRGVGRAGLGLVVVHLHRRLDAYLVGDETHSTKRARTKSNAQIEVIQT